MEILFDNRWIGSHGIARFSREIQCRLKNIPIETRDKNPISPKGLIEFEICVNQHSHSASKILISPGYTPSIFWRGDFIFTIHDLIHLDVAKERSCFKHLYYQYIVKPAIFRARKVLTVSEYSRQRILEWSGSEPAKIVVVGNGVDPSFSPFGPTYKPGYPYILYVRNTKPHKNVPRLLEAFAKLANPELRLLLSGKPDDDTRHLALRLGILERVVFTGHIPEEELPAYYRGATVVTMPSLYEGFGLPALEGMACGVPVVVSNTTSLPEVVGNAGLLVDPNDVESIANGLERVLSDQDLRQQMVQRGLERARLFNWDEVGRRVLQVLEEE